MPTASSAAGRRCGSCQAEVRSQDKYCWLCRATLDVTPILAEVAEKPGASQQQAGSSMPSATLALIITVLIVLAGVFLRAPGLGGALAVALVPVTVHLGVLTLLRKGRKQPIRKSEIVPIVVGWMSVSVFVLVVVPLVIMGAVVIALFAICGGFGASLH